MPKASTTQKQDTTLMKVAHLIGNVCSHILWRINSLAPSHPECSGAACPHRRLVFQMSWLPDD
ncbi:MAG TPA: hypothetical protein VGM01_10205, partial [Ktedonobacteraceae bacterium]